MKTQLTLKSEVISKTNYYNQLQIHYQCCVNQMVITHVWLYCSSMWFWNYHNYHTLAWSIGTVQWGVWSSPLMYPHTFTQHHCSHGVGVLALCLDCGQLPTTKVGQILRSKPVLIFNSGTLCLLLVYALSVLAQQYVHVACLHGTVLHIKNPSPSPSPLNNE